MSKSTSKNSSKNYFFNSCFDKTHLKNLISWLIKQSGEKITIDFLEKLKEIGFHEATLAGVSLGIDDLEIPTQKPLLISQAKNQISSYEQQNLFGNLTSVEKSQGMILTWNQTSENLRKSAVHQFKIKNPVNPVYMMAFSGARGNISQVRQLVAMRGLMADPQGGILEFPIQSNFREGLTITEYLISCYGARKGIVDTALRTATAGYLTRRLVDSAQHVVVNIKDCGTEKGVRLRNTDLEQQLLGRVLATDVTLSPTNTLKRNQLVSPKLAKLLSKNFQEIFVRSPLTCQAETTSCQLCYGWNLAHASLVNIGEAVGILAAQSIGEPGTQLTMRTFHTGGVGVFSDQAMKYFLAPHDGIIDYPKVLSGHFVRTPDGKIVYMLKMSSTSPQNILFQIQSLDKKEILYFVKNEDLPPGSILWVRQGEQVKKGQVLAQASQIKKSQQKMPESTHQIFSPFSGEVFFESMDTLIERSSSKTKKKKSKKKQKQDEISPFLNKFPGFGSFWIFSSQNQPHLDSAKSFISPGDLISSQTPVFQYNFYIPRRSIFKPILNKPCIGTTAAFLSGETVNFHKNVYSLVANSYSLPKFRNFRKNIFFFTKKKESVVESQKDNPLVVNGELPTNEGMTTSLIHGAINLFFWVPQSSLVASSGYSFHFFLYSKRKNSSREKVFRFSRKSRKNSDPSFYSESIFYFTKNIQKWIFSDIKNEIFSQNNLFFQTKKLFSFRKNTVNYFLFFHHDKNKQKPTLLEYNPRGRHFSHQRFLQNQKTSKVQTKFFSGKQKNYLICSLHSTMYLKKALHRVKHSLLNTSNFSSVFFQKNKGWVYIPWSSNQEKKIFKQKRNGRRVQTKNPQNKKELFSQKENFRKSFILEQGKIYRKLLFSNCKIAMKFLSTAKIGLIKSTNEISFSDIIWYSQESLLMPSSFLNFKHLKTQDISLKNRTEKKSAGIQKKFSQCFLYYKIQKNQKSSKNKKANKRKTQLAEKKNIFSQIMKNSKKIKKNQLKNVAIIYCLHEFSLQKKKDLSLDWHALQSWNQKNLETRFLKNSPLVIKQTGTLYKKYQNLRKNFTLIDFQPKSWFSSKNLLKIFINLNFKEQILHFAQQDKVRSKYKYFSGSANPVLYRNLNQSHLLLTAVKNYTIPISGFNFFFYNSFLGLEKVAPENTLSSFDFSIFLFENTWVTPDRKFTTRFSSLGKDGELVHLNSKKEPSVFIFLTKQDLVTLNFSQEGTLNPPNKFLENAFFPEKNSLFFNKKEQLTNEFNSKQLQVGDILHSLTEIIPGNVSSSGGLILNKKVNQITLRVGKPFLVSTKGLVHIFANEAIKENDLLVTLKSRRFQTQDIVQGIPKIEQLFEARQTQGGVLLSNSVPSRLQKYFISWLTSKKQKKMVLRTALPEGIEICFEKIQFFLVQSIFQAYSSQGVNISQKHIEVIVRQMTSRVRILNGGETGLLVGEIVEFKKIKKVNNELLKLSQRYPTVALYEPLVIGITKSVLQSESFLLAASFQEVSRVLVRSALSKKKDFVRGLHENIILGQFIPSGTGFISLNVKKLKK